MFHLGEAFHEGGFGMYPTLAFGLVLLAVAVQYARDPSKRFVPLLVALGTLTFSAGALGFVTGVIASIRGLAAGAAQNPAMNKPVLVMYGAGEALNCVSLALIFVVLAAMTASVGAYRLSRRAEAAA